MIYVCSPRGTGNGTDLWRSADSGATFRYVGTALANGLAPQRSLTGDLGGGDCDVSADLGNRLYLADLWAGSASVASSDDHGQTWRGVPVTQASGTMDRPWVLATVSGDVFLTGTDIQGEAAEGTKNIVLGPVGPPVGGVWVSRSVNGGQTFPQQVLAIPNDRVLGFASNLVEANGTLLLTYTKSLGEGRIAQIAVLSKDQGLTWSQRTIAEQLWDPSICVAYPVQVFPVVAAGPHGNVYASWSMTNAITRRVDLFFAASPDGGDHWGAPVLLTDRAGTRLFPWIAASGDGRVGIAWYESNKTLYPQHAASLPDRASCSWGEDQPVDWFVHYAESRDPSGPNAHFSDTTIGGAVHHGQNLERPFAEVLHAAFNPQQRAALAYMADTPDGPGQPMFAIQQPTS